MKRLLIVVFLALLLVLGIGFYYWSGYRFTPPVQPATPALQPVETLPIPEQPATTTTEKPQTPPADGFLTYTNREADYKLFFPKGSSVCLPIGEGTECKAIKTDLTDKDLQIFHMEPADTVYLDISYMKNALGMSAVDYAKRSIQWIRADKTANAVISQEQETTFAGQPAYSFVTTNVFEQRGGAYDNNGDFIDDPAFFNKPGEGHLIAKPHKIIYFDHGNYLFRVWYPADDATSEAIVNSMMFSKP